jgi:hypothetical protein
LSTWDWSSSTSRSTKQSTPSIRKRENSSKAT